MSPLRLYGVGLCGVDESVDAHHLLIELKWPKWIEFGVLVHGEEFAGKRTRCPSKSFIINLLTINAHNYKFAAHLCSSLCQNALDGDFSLVKELHELGVGRFQINATKANGVDSSRLSSNIHLQNIIMMANMFPKAEFIIQRNEETKPLWESIEQHKIFPSNISLLFDASIGRGIPISEFPVVSSVRCGYAGGINPANITSIVTQLSHSLSSVILSKPTWIDMESGIRDSKDLFSIGKCQQILDAINALLTQNVIEFG